VGRGRGRERVGEKGGGRRWGRGRVGRGWERDNLMVTALRQAITG